MKWLMIPVVGLFCLTLNAQPSEAPVSVEQNQTSGLKEQAEQKRRRSEFDRVEAFRYVNLGFGPAWFGNMNSPTSGIGFNAGYSWNVDGHFDLGLQTDFAISTEHSDAYLLDARIVANYFFWESDVSPFVGVGFGYGWASVHDRNVPNITDDHASGFAGSLEAGVKFFRTSTVNLGISGVYTQIFDQSSLGSPSVFMLKVALFY